MCLNIVLDESNLFNVLGLLVLIFLFIGFFLKLFFKNLKNFLIFFLKVSVLKIWLFLVLNEFCWLLFIWYFKYLIVFFLFKDFKFIDVKNFSNFKFFINLFLIFIVLKLVIVLSIIFLSFKRFLVYSVI